MTVSAVNFNTPPPSSTEQTSGTNDGLDQDAFLQLLVTQLRYQNPMNAMGNAEFIAQTAQFSSLEQMQDMNSSMKALLEFQKSSDKTAALNLIGKHVVVQQPAISLSAGLPADLSYSLSANADATITVCNASGGPVRTIDAGSQPAGKHTFVWDGRDDSGIRMPDGNYTYEVSALDADGNEVNASEVVSGIVDGLVFDGEPYISIGGARFPLSAVTEVSPGTQQD